MIERNILLIDDMDEWSSSASYLLNSKIDKRRYKINIVHRKNGESILQDLLLFPFDVVLMDYHMEPFNGDKYINDIHYDMTFAYVPIIFYSQDPNVDLRALIGNMDNVSVCHRTELVDMIDRRFFA